MGSEVFEDVGEAGDDASDDGGSGGSGDEESGQERHEGMSGFEGGPFDGHAQGEAEQEGGGNGDGHGRSRSFPGGLCGGGLHAVNADIGRGGALVDPIHPGVAGG